MKKLMEEFEFNGIKIKLFDEDFEHAIDNHPGEVDLDEIRSCLTNPDFISLQIRFPKI